MATWCPTETVSAATTPRRSQVIEPEHHADQDALRATVVLAGEDVTYTVVGRQHRRRRTGAHRTRRTTSARPSSTSAGTPTSNGLLDGADAGDRRPGPTRARGRSAYPSRPATADDNTAVGLGVDPLGNLYEADDTAEVRVIDPAIQLTKTVSDNWSQPARQSTTTSR